MARSILSNLGLILQIAGVLMIFPIALGFYFKELDALISYFITATALFVGGFLLNAFSSRDELDIRSSAILVTSVFFVLGVAGSIPYLYLGTFSGGPAEQITNSLFESISGFTTAGFTLIGDIDSLPSSLIFYRSLTQWIGGIGIIFILLAFFHPGDALRGLGRAIGLSRVVTGIKLVLSQVLVLYSVYLFIFVLAFYLIGFTDVVETIAITMSSLATGGLSPVTDFSAFTDSPAFFFIMLAIFIGSLNFFIHDKLVRGKMGGLFKTEFVVYIIILLVGITAFFVTSGLPLKESAFHALAASTTSGFSTQNVLLLNDMSKIVLMALMFLGGMTFSTAGGLKVLRLIMFVKAVPWVLRRLVHGEEGHMKHEDETVDGIDTHIFMLLPGLVLLTLFVSVVVFVAHGFSMSDALFESVSSYSLTGFSTGSVDEFTPVTLKWWMMFLFVIGRVEIVAFLILFVAPMPGTEHQKAHRSLS